MPLPTPTPRARRLAEMFEFCEGHGLEIGPLFQPLVPKDVADVSYADVYDRDRLVESYAHNPRVTTETVPEIDYTLWDGERMRTIGEAAKAGAPFDWVYASHVIEHVPDLIGWLREIESITADGGALVLVVPDRRYSFDAHRPPSTVGQMLQAFDDEDVVPSVRAVYDHYRGAVSATSKQLWGRQVPGYEARIHDLGYARNAIERARSGEYVDCHVWTFTDVSFPEVLQELRELGMTGWWVEKLVPTPRNELEFYAVLRRGTPPADLDQSLAAPDWITEAQELRARVAHLRGRVNRQRAALQRLRRRVQRQRRRIEADKATLEQLTRSRRWKVATMLAAPVEALRRRR